MGYFSLIKLLYFADRKMFLSYGQTITGDAMVSMDHGPVLSKIYDFIKRDRPIHDSEWSHYITEPTGYEVRNKIKAPTDELSRFEIGLLEEMHKKYGALKWWQVRNIAHNLPEWENPKGSSLPINPEVILQRAKVSAKDINCIRIKNTERSFFDSIAR